MLSASFSSLICKRVKQRVTSAKNWYMMQADDCWRTVRSLSYLPWLENDRLRYPRQVFVCVCFNPWRMQLSLMCYSTVLFRLNSLIHSPSSNFYFRRRNAENLGYQPDIMDTGISLNWSSQWRSWPAATRPGASGEQTWYQTSYSGLSNDRRAELRSEFKMWSWVRSKETPPF